MQTPRDFLGSLFESVKTSMHTPIVLDIYGDAVDMIAARDAEIRREWRPNSPPYPARKAGRWGDE